MNIEKVKWQSYFKGLFVGVIIGGGLEALFIAYHIGAIK
jgi:hypothetical protein